MYLYEYLVGQKRDTMDIRYDIFNERINTIFQEVGRKYWSTLWKTYKNNVKVYYVYILISIFIKNKIENTTFFFILLTHIQRKYIHLFLWRRRIVLYY